MGIVWNLIVEHYVTVLFVSAYVALTGFNAMVAPGVDGGGVYGWFYRFTHSLAASPAAMGIEAKVGRLVPGATTASVTETTSHTEQSSTK